jgi:TonB family protein
MDVAIFAPANLLRYAGQVLIVVAAVELGARLVRPTSARLQLASWRLVIVVCLLLPLVPVRTSVAWDATASSASRTNTAAISALAGAHALPLSAALALLPWLLIAGAIARAAWLGLGFARLRQLRADSQCIDTREATNGLAVDIDALKRALAPHADLRWHDEVTQPLTFGLRRPIVLLPRRLLNLPPDAQRAVVCHELLHVGRHDWAWMLAEEAIRTACWWHPAIWWALAHVQLHREEVIDADVIALTTARRAYMHALLAFAEQTPPTGAPYTRSWRVWVGAGRTMPLIRRRHVAARLTKLAQEVPMSRLRLTCAVTTLGLIIAAASWTSLSALPLQRASETRQPSASPKTPNSKASDDKPIKAGDSTMKPRVISEVKPVYPNDAKDAKVQGEVELEIRIAKNGSVADARVVKSIPMLDKAALDAVRKWKFAPPTLNGKPVEVLCTITTRFALK